MNKIRIMMVGLMLAGTAITLKAQERGGRIHWQVRGGMGFAAVVSVPNTDDRLGWHVGGAADIALSRNGVWRLQPGLQFAQKGWAFDGFYGNEQIMKSAFSTRLHYLQLPVLMTARLRLGGENYLTFKVGPYVAYGLSGKTTLRINDTDHEETFSQNHFSDPCNFYGVAYDKENHRVAYPKFNRWDAGLAEGIDLTFGQVIVGASVALGLTPVSDEIFMGNTLDKAVSAVFFGGGPKNFTAELSVGYQF